MSEDDSDPKKSRLESVIPGLLKRAVERGVESALDAPGDLKSFVADLKLPKEIAHYIFSQVDDTKNGLFRVVGSEVRDFLDQTNFGGELQKILTTVQFEINTTIRFRPNEGPDKSAAEAPPESGDDVGDGEEGEKKADDHKAGRPEVKTHVSVRRDEKRKRRGDRGSSE